MIGNTKFGATALCALIPLIAIPSIASAQQKPSINDMQGCQAIISHVLKKAEALADQTAAETITTGLSGYDTFIQTQVIDPGLLEFTGGDQAKADAFQEQIDAYKAGLVSKLDQKFAQPGMFTDYLTSLQKCASQAVPEGAGGEALKAAAEVILEQAKAR